MIDLYMWGTANGLRAAVALAECGLEHKVHKVDLTKGEKWETFSIKRAQSKERSCSAIPAAGHYHVGITKGNSKKIQIYGGKT